MVLTHPPCSFFRNIHPYLFIRYIFTPTRLSYYKKNSSLLAYQSLLVYQRVKSTWEFKISFKFQVKTDLGDQLVSSLFPRNVQILYSRIFQKLYYIDFQDLEMKQDSQYWIFLIEINADQQKCLEIAVRYVSKNVKHKSCWLKLFFQVNSRNTIFFEVCSILSQKYTNFDPP